MNAFLARQLREISAALEATGGRLVAVVVLAVLTLISLLAGLAFLAVALFLKVAALKGAVIAALAVGGGFLVVTLICLIILRLRRPAKKIAPPPTPEAIAKAQKRAEMAATIDQTVAPLLDVLREENLKPEEVALRLGAELTKTVGPLGLIALAVGAGFLFARRVNGDKKQ